MSPRGVAIVGMACVFPGARDLRQYRRNLVDGVDAIADLPPERWPGNRGTEFPPEHSAHIGCDRGGFISTPYRFDARRFGVMPNIVRHGDADQFVLLDLLAAAMEDAGIDPAARGHTTTDLVVGRGGYVSNKMLEVFLRADGIERIVDLLRRHAPALDEGTIACLADEMRATLPEFDADGLASSIPNLVASRAANRLDLGGAAYTVDAACASSLIAVEHAVGRLRDGRCDVALAAGINFTHVPAFWHLFTNILAISPSGRIRPFDARADGLLIGEGAGVIVLKRVEDAVRDGDRAYAVIRGVGSAGDGGAAGVLAPSSGGQIRAVERAYADACVDPATIGLVEAHGTATRAGDQAELETVAAVFGPPVAETGRRVIGSVKSMIGHTMPAAGMASLIKAALALADKVLPPSLHCDQPHAALRETDFFVTGVARPWLRDPGSPRRAGVNAFGFGGVNAHVVLEEAAPRATAESDMLRPRPVTVALHRPTELLVFAGKDAPGLATRLRRTAAFVREDCGGTTLEDLAATLSAEAAGADTQRLSLVRASLDGLADELVRLATTLEADGDLQTDEREGVFFVAGDGTPPGKVAALFPGIAFPGLVGEFPGHVLTNCLHFPCVREAFDPVEARDAHPEDPIPTSLLLVPPAYLEAPVRSRLQRRFGLVMALSHADEQDPSPPPPERNLANMGMLANNWASWQLLQSLGIPVDMLCGQSLGDVSAVLAAGMLDFDANVARFWELSDLRILHVETGVSAVVGASEERLAPLLEEYPGLLISLHLSPSTLVVGGPHDAIEAFAARLRKERILVQPLPYPAIHTPQVERMVEQFEAVAGPPEPLRPARITIYSGQLAAPMPDDPEEVQEVLRNNVLRPIRFWQTVHRMYEDGARFVLQVGTGTLAANSRSVLEADDAVCAAMDVAHRHPLTQLQRLCGQLFAHGLEFDLAGLHVGREIRRLPLDAPRPPAEPRRDLVPLNFYWPPLHAPVREPPPARAPAEPTLPFLGSIVHHEPGERIRSRVRLDLDEQAYLADHTFVPADGLKPLRETLPVLPLTMTLEILAENAAYVAQGLGLVAIRDVHARRWLAFEEQDALDLDVDAEVVARTGGVVTVRAEVRRDDTVAASAFLEFAEHYRSTLPPLGGDAPDAAPFPVPADELYASRFLFHGPRFQCIRAVHARSGAGIRGELEVLDRSRLFASCPAPLLLTDPVVLDGAGQLVGTFFHGEEGFVLPVAIERIEFRGPPPAPGARLLTQVDMTTVDRDARRVAARIEIGDGSGGVWCRIDGWRDIVFRWTDALLQSTRHPRRHTVARERDLPGVPDGAVATVVRAADLQDLQDDWLARIYLTREEWDAYVAAGADTRRRRPWLFGRIAAKDAVRRWLLRRSGGEEMLHPLEVVLANDASGRPVVASVAGSSQRPSVSITHIEQGAAAIAGPERLGIDMEPAGAGSRLTPEHFATEREIARWRELESGDPDGAWLTRLWCAKEAAAKALGRGLEGRPKAWEALDVSAEGVHAIQSVETGGAIEVWTSRDDGLVLAIAQASAEE